MARTLLEADDVATGALTRALLNTTTAGSAVIAKVIAGTGVSLTSTGADAGTGDVTINLASGAAAANLGLSGALGSGVASSLVTAMTGSGALVGAASPTLTGTANVAALTATGVVTAATIVASNVSNTYATAGAVGTAGWLHLGTFTAPQNGSQLSLRLHSANGFNAGVGQSTTIQYRFATSNASSVDANGFAGWGEFFELHSDADTGVLISTVANAAGVSATAFDIYVYTGSGTAYSGTPCYTVEIPKSGTASWTHVGTFSTTSPGVAGTSTIQAAVNTMYVASPASFLSTLAVTGAITSASLTTTGAITAASITTTGAGTFDNGINIGTGGQQYIWDGGSNSMWVRAGASGANVYFNFATDGFHASNGGGFFAGPVTCYGLTNYSGATQLNGGTLVSSDSINVGGYTRAQLTTLFPAVNSSGGAGFAWNYSGGVGETDLFINRNGGGGGGLYIYDVPSTTGSPTQIMKLTGAGALSVPGAVSAASAILSGSSTGTTTLSSANASTTSYTLTLPSITDTVATVSTLPPGMRSGSGAPSSGTGVIGDFYIDNTNSLLYGPKTSSGWVGGAISL